MTPLYLVGEPADESRHAEWMRDRNRRGFDARQFREQVVRVAGSFIAAAAAMGADIRRVAAEFSRRADELGREFGEVRTVGRGMATPGK